MKRIITYYLKPYYLKMAGGFFVKFAGTIMDLCLPWILAYMIDTVTLQNDRNQIFYWGILMVICSFLAVSLNIIANRMASRVASDSMEQVRHDLFEKAMYLSDREIDEVTKPSLISRLTSDTYNIHQLIARMQRLGVRAPILLIGGIAITMTLEPALSMILISLLPVLALITTVISKKSIPLFRRLQQSIDEFVRVVREDIGGIRVIKALSKGDYERQRFDAVNKEVVDRERRAGMTTAVITPTMNIILNMGLVLVIFAGAYLVNRGESQVGKILAFMTYFTIILNAMLSVSKMFVMISRGSASADRIVMILDAPQEPLVEALQEEHVQACACEGAEGNSRPDAGIPRLEFEHVFFSYNKAEYNLEDISFSIRKGETLGIIGETGSGKSTIARLMLRFYDADKGEIRLDGRPLKTFPLETLRKKYGVAFQNDTIFAGDILDNVRLWRELDEEQVKQALLYAKASEFVSEKEGDIRGRMDIKGANLSGGQKQRILIARALAAHPDVLILDDSSSALDYKTDAALRRELREHFSDTTCVIIAQRVSSIRQADHILVLEDGKAAGYGTHEELLRSCESYREISRIQMGAGNEEQQGG